MLECFIAIQRHCLTRHFPKCSRGQTSSCLSGWAVWPDREEQLVWANKMEGERQLARGGELLQPPGGRKMASDHLSYHHTIHLPIMNGTIHTTVSRWYVPGHGQKPSTRRGAQGDWLGWRNQQLSPDPAYMEGDNWAPMTPRALTVLLVCRTSLFQLMPTLSHLLHTLTHTHTDVHTHTHTFLSIFAKPRALEALSRILTKSSLKLRHDSPMAAL